MHHWGVCATLVVMNTNPRTLMALSLSFVTMTLVGCNKAISPSFEALGVEEIERGEDSSVLAFRVRATNPNNEPIPLRTVSYRVQINGEQVFEGIRSPETTLHTFSDSEFVLPAVIPSAYLQGKIDYALLGSVQYIPPGRLSEVLFDADIKVPEAILDLEGTIDTGN